MTAKSFVDAAIIVAAKQMGCTAFYSEDLNAGQNYDGVTVIEGREADHCPGCGTD